MNHEALLFKLRSVCVSGAVFSVIRQFLSGRRQCVSVDGGLSSFVDVVYGVPQGSVLGPLLFILYTADLFSIVENLLVGYADDATLISVAQRPTNIVSVSNSLQCDIDKISKLSFERHGRYIAASASQRIGIMRRGLKIFDSVEVVHHCFNSFMLPVLEYASVLWGSAAHTHSALLNRIGNRCSYLMNDVVPCNLNNRRLVAGLCVLYKFRERVSYPLFSCLPDPYRRERLILGAEALNEFAFEPVRYRTNQYSRSFIPAFVDKWNSLGNSVFDGVGIGMVGS